MGPSLWCGIIVGTGANRCTRGSGCTQSDGCAQWYSGGEYEHLSMIFVQILREREGGEGNVTVGRG